MGFLKKAWNFITGKGYQEEEEKIQDKELQESLQKAEETQTTQEQQQIKESETQEIQENIITPTKKEVKEPQEIQAATRKYEKTGKIKDIEKKIITETAQGMQFQPTTNLNQLNNIYNQLLKKSTISTIDSYGNEDEALIKILIENRNKLQHRFTGEIRIITTGGEGQLSIDGILAEHLNDIYKFITIGATYTSQELQVAMQNAQTYFEKQYGSIGGNITAPPNKKVTIQDIQISMTFA